MLGGALHNGVLVTLIAQHGHLPVGMSWPRWRQGGADPLQLALAGLRAVGEIIAAQHDAPQRRQLAAPQHGDQRRQRRLTWRGGIALLSLSQQRTQLI